ncbi:hypothetical protein ACJX0J_038955 [Zea mays]
MPTYFTADGWFDSNNKQQPSFMRITCTTCLVVGEEQAKLSDEMHGRMHGVPCMHAFNILTADYNNFTVYLIVIGDIYNA